MDALIYKKEIRKYPASTEQLNQSTTCEILSQIVPGNKLCGTYKRRIEFQFDGVRAYGLHLNR